MAITMVRSSTVVPSKPSERQLMYLLSLDISFSKVHYNLRVLFYEHIKASDYSQFVATLKESLADMLVYFYPLAGRLTNDDGGRLVIDCNDTGVDFREAQTGATFNELQDAQLILLRCSWNWLPWATSPALICQTCPCLPSR
ncbi:hypothetical protein L7F22_034503 [Adiantum nelumboides]|nr:hypothetical protein [Adiantum nelumboides]